MALDIVIERPATQETQKSGQLALVRLSGVSCSRRNYKYSEAQEDGQPQGLKPLPVEAWIVSDSLDEILKNADPIFIEDVNEGMQRLQGMYGSVVKHELYSLRTCLRKTPSVFICLQGVDSTKSLGAVIKDIQQVGTAGVLSPQYDSNCQPGSLSQRLLNVDHNYSRQDVDRADLGGAVYARVEWATCTFEDEAFSALTLKYVSMTYDPKRDQRRASAKRGAEKRKARAIPGAQALSNLFYMLQHLEAVGDASVKVSMERHGSPLRGEHLHLPLMRLLEIQTVLGFPYRKSLKYSCDYGSLSFSNRIGAILKCEAALLKHPVLAPLVDWLKTEQAWFETQPAPTEPPTQPEEEEGDSNVEDVEDEDENAD